MDHVELNTKAVTSFFAKKYKVSEKDVLTLLAYVLNFTYSDLFFKKELDISTQDFTRLADYFSRLKKQEPISKIIQRKEFYGIEFKTNEYTLDPRPETELIVDLFRKYYEDPKASLKILDLGSGTGCIGLTILSFYKNSSCNFVDIDEATINVAMENASTLKLLDMCKFTISNWFSNITDKYDVIVSNPPYVASNYKLDESVLFDPKPALFAGTDGMGAYKIILPQAHKFLNHRGKLILEIGYDQKDKILEIPCKLNLVEIAKDLSGISRTVVFEHDIHTSKIT